MAEHSSLRAMVVDDEETVIAAAVELLQTLDVKVIATATDGAEAFRVLDGLAEFPDIILCDLSMPDMDGIQFMRHLAERPVRSALILLGCLDSSVLRTVEAMAHSHDLYVLGMVPKPLQIETVAKMLRTYDAAKSTSKQSISQLITLDEFEAGLKSDAVILVFQPKVDFPGRKVQGFEALARWNHPVHGLLGPAAFIPLAEEAGRMDALTDVIFRKAMIQGGEWRTRGLNMNIAVNLSVDNLNRLDLPEYIVATALSAGMDPSNVTLELTESRVMSNLKTSLETLGRLRLKGISLAIDDFGTGYSSLEQLKRSPFTEIKIDRAFVFDAANDSASRAILESSVSLGKKLNLTVVAEGAESEADLQTACSLGCDLIQGYVIGKPMRATFVPTWVGLWENQNFSGKK